ncbi:Rrf2 family transcriptional regulator [Francisella frigiditurris]|uniref:Rrf2 family protein n=1 Tax=Francisella frigiditurris TaxID=1542390 RepID=A0A1J0KRX0_9GAMM|nr:Rrf2 family transcriptional regulator [Francisella frigiditurris]APC96489.1 Rrf2 family protein [Francisella frigiditurris]
MNLTSFTDYSLRVLIILGSNPSCKFKTKDLADNLGIKLNHATKVIHNLSNLEYIRSYKGRDGGISISQGAYESKLSKIVKDLEPLNIVECFSIEKYPKCFLLPQCKLKSILHQATNDFIKRLEKYTLLDICNFKNNE